MPDRIRELVKKINSLVREDNKDYQTAAMFMEKQSRNLSLQINNLVTAIAKGTPPEFVNPEIEKLKKELKQINLQKENLQQVKPMAKPVDEEKVISYFCRLDEVIKYGTNREKRQFIRSFIRRLEFEPTEKKVTIFWYHDPLKKTPFKRIDQCGNADKSRLRHQKMPSFQGFRDFDRKLFALLFWSYFAQDVCDHTSPRRAGWGVSRVQLFAWRDRARHG